MPSCPTHLHGVWVLFAAGRGQGGQGQGHLHGVWVLFAAVEQARHDVLHRAHHHRLVLHLRGQILGDMYYTWGPSPTKAGDQHTTADLLCVVQAGQIIAKMRAAEFKPGVLFTKQQVIPPC